MRACPQCSVAEIEFNERYRVDGETIPAWFCESPRCGYVEFVRARNRHINKTREKSSLLHVKAVRAMMRAQATTGRSKKVSKRAPRLSRTKKND